MIAPYDRVMTKLNSAEKREWVDEATVAARTMLNQFDLPENAAVEVHAGKAYVDVVRQVFAAVRPDMVIRTPLEGLGMGRQLKWYKDQNATDGSKETKMFETISERAMLEDCAERLRARIDAEADERGEIKVGYQGDNETVTGMYIKRLDLWAACTQTGVGGGGRYWNAFGFGYPFERPLTITVEVNSPIEGINRRIGGVFATDGERVLITHRGKVGGGRRGIGKAAFREFWDGDTTEIEDGGKRSDVIPIGHLEDDDLCDKLAHFVRVVQAFKAGATS